MRGYRNTCINPDSFSGCRQVAVVFSLPPVSPEVAADGGISFFPLERQGALFSRALSFFLAYT